MGTTCHCRMARQGDIDVSWSSVVCIGFLFHARALLKNHCESCYGRLRSGQQSFLITVGKRQAGV
jgi:hypothetical protein